MLFDRPDLVFNAVLQLAHAGAPLATTLAVYLNAALSLRALIKGKLYIPCKQWRLFLLPIVLAVELMLAISSMLNGDKAGALHSAA